MTIRVTTLLISISLITATTTLDARVTDGVRLCADFTGVDAGAKLAACIADLPAVGGIADARGLDGFQTISTDPFSGVSKPGRLLLGAGTYTVSAPITIPSNWLIQGANDYATVFKAMGDLPEVLKGRNSTGVTVTDLKIDGNGTAGVGLNLDHDVVGTSTQNRVYRTRVFNTTRIAISMNNNGDSTLEDVAIVIKSGSSITWDDRGGNINMTRVLATEPNENVRLAFQTAVLDDCDLRAIHITFNSEQFRSLGGYYYAAANGATFDVEVGQWLRQADFIGTRFEITDDRVTGGAAINGKFVTGVFLSDAKFGNAQNETGRTVFGSNFGSENLFAPAFVWLFGGTVDTAVTNAPRFNPPSSVFVQAENFISAPNVTPSNYRSFGSAGNDGTSTVLITSNGTNKFPLVVRGVSGQAADLQQWQDSNGHILAKIASNGGIQVGSNGAVLAKTLTGESSTDAVSLTDGGAHGYTVVIPGAGGADVSLCSHDELPAGVAVIVSAHAAKDSVTCTVLNRTGGDLRIPAGVVHVVVMKY
jgi:hypothetical protein